MLTGQGKYLNINTVGEEVLSHLPKDLAFDAFLVTKKTVGRYNCLKKGWVSKKTVGALDL